MASDFSEPPESSQMERLEEIAEEVLPQGLLEVATGRLLLEVFEFESILWSLVHFFLLSSLFLPYSFLHSVLPSFILCFFSTLFLSFHPSLLPFHSTCDPYLPHFFFHSPHPS